MPFSDPIADGLTIQRSTQRALEAGTTAAGCLAMVRQLRTNGITTPIMLMGYMNPILAFGMAEFVRAAATAGVDGLIVPDLPPEESAELKARCGHRIGIHLFPGTTSNAHRIALVTEQADDFIYMVSVAG